MKVSLPYGRGEFILDLPDRSGVRVIGNEYPEPLSDAARALRQSLDSPVGCASLAKLLPPKGKISVLVSDITRGGSARALLPHLLDYLEEHGAGPERTDVILALGMHRAHSRAELEMHLGENVLSRWQVVEHDATDESGLIEAGVTPFGTPCSFNKRVASSGLAVLLGSVTFHYFAGYGGGRKLVLPGIAGEKTILANHRLSLESDPAEGLVDACRPGNLEHNPVHEDMLAGARLLAVPLFAVNVVSGASAPAFINAGEIDSSHREACSFLSRNFEINLERQYKAVVLSAGGYPRDINLLQSHKALRNACRALEEGGLMLAAAECREGIGSDSFLQAFSDGRQGVPRSVRSKYGLNSQAAVSTFDMTGRFSIYLKASMEESLLSRFGFCAWRDEYTPYVLSGLDEEEILVIKNASMFLPTAVWDERNR